jgi:hypothetical protein
MRFTSSDGKSADAEFKPGDIVWRDAETHAGENIGTADCHVLQVELKHAKPAAKMAKRDRRRPSGEGNRGAGVSVSDPYLWPSADYDSQTEIVRSWIPTTTGRPG